MKPRRVHLGDSTQRWCQGASQVATMEPRRLRLGDNQIFVSSTVNLGLPQWSPGEFAWETLATAIATNFMGVPQWSPGEFAWETMQVVQPRSV